MCQACDAAVEDAILNPVDKGSEHYRPSIMIEGRSMAEVRRKREVLKRVENVIMGIVKDTPQAVFDKMCECIGIEFCYECGTTDNDAQKLTELARQFGLKPDAGRDSYSRQILHDHPYATSFHTPSFSSITTF
jgi:hypothetical protein